MRNSLLTNDLRYLDRTRLLVLTIAICNEVSQLVERLAPATAGLTELHKAIELGWGVIIEDATALSKSHQLQQKIIRSIEIDDDSLLTTQGVVVCAESLLDIANDTANPQSRVISSSDYFLDLLDWASSESAHGSVALEWMHEAIRILVTLDDTAIRKTSVVDLLGSVVKTIEFGKEGHK